MEVNKKHIGIGLIGVLLGGGLFYLGVEVIAPKLEDYTSDNSDGSELVSEEQVKTSEEDVLERDTIIVNKTIDELKGVLLNPDGLQINEVMIHRYQDDNTRDFDYEKDGDIASVYIDYSGMNRMGGYSRDYAYASFNECELMEGSFFDSFKSNYISGKERIIEGDTLTHYFDIENLDSLN